MFTDLLYYLIAAIIIGTVGYVMIREGQNQKIWRKFSTLSSDEVYLVGCLLQVPSSTIYGQAIRNSISAAMDDDRIRTILREVSESLSEEPETMHRILGAEAFTAVHDYYNDILISSGQAVPGITPR